MTLGFIADYWGWERAENLAVRAEYLWNKDRLKDIFG